MKEYISQLKQYVQNQYKYDNAISFHSLLEMIWYYHTQYYPIDTDTIGTKFQSVSPVIKTLSRKRARQLTRIVIDLCVEHERAAFIEGVRVGAQLYSEISD